MAVSQTARMALTRWSAGTDPFTRAQMDASMAAIEGAAAGYLRGTYAARPAASAANIGFLYEATDQGGKLFWSTGSSWLALGGITPFGTGDDGDVTITGTTTLTRDMQYRNLTVNAGGVLNTAGFRVHVSATLTLNGSIRNNGVAGTNGGAGSSLPGNVLGGAGGGSGTVAGGAAGATANAAGQAGTSLTSALGGNAGAGGASGQAGSPAGLGGTATAPTNAEGGTFAANSPLYAMIGGHVGQAGVSPWRGGAGGGSGGAGDGGSKSAGDANAGSGGGGGGLVLVLASVVAGTGSIEAKGGAGGAAIDVAGSGTRGAGGGGGGGGGAVMVISTTGIGGVSTTTTGGAAGAGVAPGSAGQAGSAGSTTVITI